MPFRNLLFTLRRKFSERFHVLFDGRILPNASGVSIPRPCTSEPEYVQKIRRVVEKHLAEADFSVGALCHECHICQPQLYRKLTALSGLSPIHFIHSIRLQKAKELLRQTDLTIAEVAYETGFNSPAYFTRLYVKTFGMTPSEYRKNGGKPADE